MKKCICAAVVMLCFAFAQGQSYPNWQCDAVASYLNLPILFSSPHAHNIIAVATGTASFSCDGSASVTCKKEVWICKYGGYVAYKISTATGTTSATASNATANYRWVSGQDNLFYVFSQNTIQGLYLGGSSFYWIDTDQTAWFHCN